jgi:hypothetical protein
MDQDEIDARQAKLGTQIGPAAPRRRYEAVTGTAR